MSTIYHLAVLWTPQSEDQALDVAASRISCIVIALVVMAVLAIAIYPNIASELVSVQYSRLLVWSCSLLHQQRWPKSLVEGLSYGLGNVLVT